MAAVGRNKVVQRPFPAFGLSVCRKHPPGRAYSGLLLKADSACKPSWPVIQDGFGTRPYCPTPINGVDPLAEPTLAL
ncbi:MAG: hypothetical protein NTX45_10945 [Proteobacteria bacterium]|nr:hypothetical protein [Pseudomonadota bacterium]